MSQTITYIDGPCKGRQHTLNSASIDVIDVPVVSDGPFQWLKYVRSGPLEFRLSHESYLVMVPAGCIQADKPDKAPLSDSEREAITKEWDQRTRGIKGAFR